MNPKHSFRPASADWILILLLAMCSTLLMLASEPEVPLHYDFAGVPDKYGNRFELLLLPLVGLLLFIFIKWMKRFSRFFNYPVRITPENSLKQEKLALELLDNYALITLLIFNLILIHLLYNTLSGESSGMWIWGIIFLISYLFPIPVYLIRACK